MSKAVLRFKLPEEQEEFGMALHGVDYRSIIVDLDYWLKAQIKYGDNSQFTGPQEVRDKLWEIVIEYGVEEDFV